MKPELGAAFSPAFGGRPAHMSAVDFVLWSRFRRGLPTSWRQVWFDVAVGSGAGVGAAVEANVAAAWTRITRKRVDVVADAVSGWVLVEIRGAAGPGAIGSLLSYRRLWLDDPPDARAVSMLLVTDLFPDDLASVLNEYGIALALV